MTCSNMTFSNKTCSNKTCSNKTCSNKTWRKRSFAAVSFLFVVLWSLSVGTLHARDAGDASRTFAAAQTAKQHCVNACRARYRDCRRMNQLPSFECQSVYQDCTRYSCAGLGPG
jgi:hypothetical protein